MYFQKLNSIWSPNYNLPDKTQQTLEWEVLRIMAALGYPYRIDKTQLKTISNLRRLALHAVDAGLACTCDILCVNSKCRNADVRAERA